MLFRGLLQFTYSPTDRNAVLGREGTYVEGLVSVQRGEVGDTTAGLSLGQWTATLAQKLMAQYEIAWDEWGITGSERETRRNEVADEYRQHIANGDSFYPCGGYRAIAIRKGSEFTWVWIGPHDEYMRIR
jgi:hypothetical protein